MSTKAQSKGIQLGQGTEVVTLRAMLPGERDYCSDLEDESWCQLRRGLSRKYGLRFLVRKIKQGRKKGSGTVTIGGVRVQDCFMVDNGNRAGVFTDCNIGKGTLEELKTSLLRDECGNVAYVLERRNKFGTSKFRAQFRLRVGDWFEWYIKYRGQSWAGNVTLVDIKEEEPAFAEEPAYLLAKFAVCFEELEDEDEDEDEL